jgi:hypothetical protein
VLLVYVDAQLKVPAKCDIETGYNYCCSCCCPVQALGEFAIIADHPDDVRKKLLESASNFGFVFYGLLHKFGVAQKPSLFIDGTPVLGPAAEALNPEAYIAAAAAA